MTGRLPYHVNQIILSDSAVDLNAPKEMTAMPRKLKEGGYSTHMVGKWHVGLDHPSATPHGRGFDTSMGYLTAAEVRTLSPRLSPLCQLVQVSLSSRAFAACSPKLFQATNSVTV